MAELPVSEPSSVSKEPTDDEGVRAGLATREEGDFQLEETLGRILRFGVHASSACLAVGLLLVMATTLGSVGATFMLVGLVALMGTPVARVAMSVVEYGRRRDWTFFVLTLIVLAELCAGIVAALVFHRRL
jgi:uncharacterized membrane protein